MEVCRIIYRNTPVHVRKQNLKSKSKILKSVNYVKDVDTCHESESGFTTRMSIACLTNYTQEKNTDWYAWGTDQGHNIKKAYILGNRLSF